MKKIQLMELITKVTYLHIGQEWRTRKGMYYFVVLNSNPNERKPVWLGVLCWLAQIPLLMAVILGGLSTATALAEGYGFTWFLLSAIITGLSAFAMHKIDKIFEKRPSWNQEDYFPTIEERKEWSYWVHCQEEYGTWETWWR